jgi:LysR family transcriptional regulator, nitrogen assimilation regulatory protein
VIQHFEGDVLDRTSNLRAEPLFKEEISLLGPMDDPAGLGSGPVSASRLAEIPMILPGRPHGLRLVVDALLGEAEIAPRIELEMDAMPSSLSLVERGMGYTLLSYGPARHLVEARPDAKLVDRRSGSDPPI